MRSGKKVVHSPCSTIRSCLTKTSTVAKHIRWSVISKKPRVGTGLHYFCKFLEPDETKHHGKLWAEAYIKYSRLSKGEKVRWTKIGDHKNDPSRARVKCVSQADTSAAIDSKEQTTVTRAAKSSGFLIYMNVAHQLRAPTVQDVRDWQQLSDIDHAALAAISDHRNFLEEAGFLQHLEGDATVERYVNNRLLWNPVSRFMMERCRVQSVEDILQAEKDFFNAPSEAKTRYLRPISG